MPERKQRYPKRIFRSKNESESKDRQKNLQEKRKLWTKTKEAHPESSTVEIRKIIPSIYIWLYRNDRDWLQQNLPKVNRKAVRQQRVDWIKRDEKYVECIPLAVEKILQKKEKLERLTITSIGREIKALGILQQHLDKLPKTSKLLSSVTEDFENFAVRKVQSVFEAMKNKGQTPQKWQLVKAAGVERQIHKEKVRLAIENLLTT